MSDPRPVYLSIADAIAADVERGSLLPGDRLPPQRDLARGLGVTLGTVTRAYAEARHRGLVVGEVGRGTYVRTSAESGTIGQPAAPSDIDLGINAPPLGLAREELAAAIVAVEADEPLDTLLRYQPPEGALRHRETGATWLSRPGFEVSPDDIVLTMGAQHAVLVGLAALARPGDLVLTEAVTYPGIKAAARILHLRIEGCPLDDDGLIPDALEELIIRERPSVLCCTPTIHNPTAMVTSPARRGTVAAVCARHGVAVLEDEINAWHVVERHAPIVAREGVRGAVLTSVSKCLAPGLRLGFLRVAGADRDAALAAVNATTVMASPLPAEVTTRLLENGGADRIIMDRRCEIRARNELTRERLDGLVPESHPDVSGHLWLPLPSPWRSEELAGRARAKGLRVAPSETFAVGRGAAPHRVRVSIAAPERRVELERGLEILAGLLSHPPSPSCGTVV